MKSFPIDLKSLEDAQKSESFYQIRLMTEADAKQAAEIEADIFANPWTLENFLDSLKLDYACYYAAFTEQGELLGYCGFYQSEDLAEITNVAVKPSARRMHIARNMLEKMLREGGAKGIRQFTLEVRVGNLPAIHLYEKLGFIREGIRKNFYRNPVEDAFIMNLTI